VSLIKFGERDILNYGFADVMEIFSAVKGEIIPNQFNKHARLYDIFDRIIRKI
jgi:hypothetical protein